jgi:hypothetical protein
MRSSIFVRADDVSLLCRWRHLLGCHIYQFMLELFRYGHYVEDRLLGSRLSSGTIAMRDICGKRRLSFAHNTIVSSASINRFSVMQRKAHITPLFPKWETIRCLKFAA